MSTWYIAILLTIYSPEPQDRIHIIFDPYFNSLEECNTYTKSQEGSEFILNHLFEEYGTEWSLKNLFCGPEKAVLKVLGIDVTEA